MIGRAARMTLSTARTQAVQAPPDPETADTAAADTEESGGFVRLAVSDTGIGMDAGTVARESKTFFTTKPPGKSTGLALASRFCRQSGGGLTSDSTPGVWTTVRIYLPVAGVAAGCDATTEPCFAVSGRVAVLPQNEPVMRDGLRTALLARGFRVPVAASVPSLTELAPELPVADLSAEDGDGADVLRAWREQIPGLPLVVLVNQADHPDLAGAAGALVKPVSPPDLAAAAVREMARAGRVP
jgi:CheY-like chemotaxis protein